MVQAERMRRLHADPEFAAKHAERMRRLHADPEFAAKHAERMRRLNADPEFAAKHAERMRRLHAEGRAGRKRLPLTEEQRKVYTKLRPIVGRDAALIEARRGA